MFCKLFYYWYFHKMLFSIFFTNFGMPKLENIKFSLSKKPLFPWKSVIITSVHSKKSWYSFKTFILRVFGKIVLDKNINILLFNVETCSFLFRYQSWNPLFWSWCIYTYWLHCTFLQTVTQKESSVIEMWKA